MLLLLLGCTAAPTSAEDAGPFYDAAPAITALQWSCDVEASEWSFEITTEHWTGGGRVYMARDAATLEEHRVRSVGAAADGSTDSLALELDIVADWRDASSGASTRWRCDEQDALSFLVTVLTPDGSSQADCRVWGADLLLWEAVAQVDGCETILEEPDTGSEQ